MKKIILHIDMDAFFAAVEQLDNPSYRGKPVIIGANPQKGKGRGVVSTASYEARKFGVHSAQPISKAYRLCPQGIYIRPRMDRYLYISRKIMTLLGDFSPLVEQVSVDEAFMDCTGCEKLLGSAEIIAEKIKNRIKEEIGITASIGIASNKSIAKIASDMNKPEGTTIVPTGSEKKFLSPLSIKKLWGVGKKTEAILEKSGFKTIGDMAIKPAQWFRQLFGKNGEHLWALANGIDDRQVEGDSAGRKSISEEITFKKDVSDDNIIREVIFKICDKISHEIRLKKLLARTVNIKVRLEGFETYTRSFTFLKPTNIMTTIFENAEILYHNFDRSNKKIRLIGVGLSNFIEEVSYENQLDLFSSEVKSKKDLKDDIYDQLKIKYGNKINRARLLKNKKKIKD